MKDEALELAGKLQYAFGDNVETSFVDVSTDEMSNYPEIEKILNRVKLPLTVINGEPRFHGGLGVEMIVEAIKDISV